MKVLGKKIMKNLTRSIRGTGKARVYQGKQALKQGLMNVRKPGSVGSSFVKKTVSTAPNKPWPAFKKKAKNWLYGAGTGGVLAGGATTLSGAAQGGKDSENINIYVKRTTFHGMNKK